MNRSIEKKIIPKEIRKIIEMLESFGFEAYLVGGVVRDILMKREPKDWDIATDAKPEEIQKIFPNSFYENKFGTVSVKTKNFGIVEVTTYRIEDSYSDSRHPDNVVFTKKLVDDLKRRDFTMNAIALSANGKIFDPFDGESDIRKKLIRCVGNSQDRFQEDALRMLRAVRFSCELDFQIEEKTSLGIKKKYNKLSKISAERIRDEFSKIILSPNPEKGIRLLDEYNLLQYVVPEVLVGKGIKQNHHHVYDVFEHSIKSLGSCPSKKLEVRLASLLHDIGKPGTKKESETGSTFYNHEFLSARITKSILERLKFPKKVIEYTSHLVKNHMFFYNYDLTDAAVRRILRRIGPENLEDFIDLRVADRLGSGIKTPKSKRLIEFEKKAFLVRHHPISTHDLKIDGNKVMEILKEKPGKVIGEVLNHLLELVIENPERNNEKWLEEEVVRWKNGKKTKLKTPKGELSKKRMGILIQDF